MGEFMKYAMLSTLIPIEAESDFKNNSKANMQDAANALQWNLYEGFSKNLGHELPLFNVLPAGSFPQYYKKMLVKRMPFNKHSINLGFCNIKLIRNYFIKRSVYKELKKWCESTSEDKILFIYTLAQAQVSAVAKLKRKFENLSVCSIIADLPDMCNLSSKRSIFEKLFIKFSSARSYEQLSSIDSFVLLTDQMAEYMNISQPYIVVEGVVPYNCSVKKPEMNDCDIKTILYTGTLHRKFGILHLLKAFENIKGEDYRLVICGIGDSENEIKAAAKVDKRIIYKGQLDRSEILQLQKNATVLVNPRLNNDEFTKYSFPSKTMEYLMSGVPTVAYRLDGMSKEYAEFLNSPVDDTETALTQALVNICEKGAEERLDIGIKAQAFVLNNKNSLIQTKRILEFLKGLDRDSFTKS